MFLVIIEIKAAPKDTEETADAGGLYKSESLFTKRDVKWYPDKIRRTLRPQPI